MTPSGTSMVRPPRPCPAPRATGAPLVGSVRLLTPAGLVDLEAETQVVLGRDTTCDVVLDDPLSSRRHARITASRAGVLLEDLQSTNGVYLNGVRLEQYARLRTGDHIMLGTTEVSGFSTRR